MFVTYDYPISLHVGPPKSKVKSFTGIIYYELIKRMDKRKLKGCKIDTYSEVSDMLEVTRGPTELPVGQDHCLSLHDSNTQYTSLEVYNVCKI